MPDRSGGAPRLGGGSPVTIITGGSEGIGLALAKEFARGGHDVLLVARTPEKLEAARGEIAASAGVAVHILSADLATREGRDRLEAAVREEGLHCAYLVNNAAIGDSGAFAESDPERLDALVRLNVAALTDLARRFLPGMIARGHGGVLNVASLGGFTPGPWQAAYYASKAYVLSLSEALAHEVRGTGVRVAALAPGPVNTRFHARMGAESALYRRFQGVMDAGTVARSGYSQFMRGRKVIVPGAINLATAGALRYLPHFALTPFTAWLLKPHDERPDV